MSSTVRPIHLPGATALESLRQRAQSTIATWARQWVSAWQQDDARLASLVVAAAGSPLNPRVPEFEELRCESGSLWVRRACVDRSSFGRAIVGSELMPQSVHADDWIAGIARDAWQARNRALCCELLRGPDEITTALPAAALPASLLAFGSGAVRFDCEPLGLHVIADRNVWRSVAPRQRATTSVDKLVPLDRAANRASVRVEATLGSVELELPKLLDLQCGDVLRLPERLDRPVAVLCAGKLLARATLGERDGRRSVQLIANHP
jgi:hypothetical protein